MDQSILTINAGSSSIKFAVFTASEPLKRSVVGQIERVGQAGTTFSVSFGGRAQERQSIDASDHAAAAQILINWGEKQLGRVSFTGIGHRVVHGGLRLTNHQIINSAVLEELRKAQPLDPAHLPREIAMIDAFAKRYSDVPQVACFDTTFHRDLPRLAQLLPVPRKYNTDGLRRFGFHGLSYSYLLEALGRIAGEKVVAGRVIFAHLGSGASMAAVSGGKPVETTMAFTPLAGLVMGKRPGDLDPGFLVYLMRVEKMSAVQIDALLNEDCGLKGVSETSSDMRDLSVIRQTDARAAEAVDLFCYRARQWIGALAATMGGLDTIVFSGGIGEHAPDVRKQILHGLEFLGVGLDSQKNAQFAADTDSMISAANSRVGVYVVRTDEEAIIAKIVMKLLCGKK
jgi:acetate kinase